jgi:hypothetical protein
MNTTVEANPTPVTDQKPASSKRDKQDVNQGSGKGNTGRRAPNAQRVSPTPAQFRVDATTIKRKVRVGDTKLAMAVFKNWPDMHRALHYLTDFTRTSLRGKVVSSANRGIAEYLSEKLTFAHEMLKTATDLAENNGITMGEHGQLKEEVLEICCRTENDVLALVSLLDDYVIVMDSLWIASLVDDRKRDDAHNEVRRTIQILHQLLTKMYGKMVAYRRNFMADKLTKSEEIYARDIEVLILDVAGINLLKIREDEEAAKAAEAAKKAEAKEAARLENATRRAANAKARELAEANSTIAPVIANSNMVANESQHEVALAA